MIMPKKSNKTAHVLSLLTNGGGELSEENISVSRADSEKRATLEAPRKEVIVELQDSSQSDILSDLVKSDLQKELDKQLTNSKEPLPEEEVSVNERPPYSPTFMAKFGLNSVPESVPEKEEPEPDAVPVPLDQVKSQLYILEDFDEEEKEDVIVEKQPEDSPSVLISDAKPQHVHMKHTVNHTAKVLRNLAEDAIQSRVAEVMQSFNMCTCQDCVYEVMAFALNHTKPLYTVTEQDQLSKKLSSYENQYGMDLTSALTKACIKVKINSKHPAHSKLRQK